MHGRLRRASGAAFRSFSTWFDRFNVTICRKTRIFFKKNRDKTPKANTGQAIAGKYLKNREYTWKNNAKIFSICS